MLRAQKRSSILAALLLLPALGCGSSEDDGGVLPFVIQATSQSVAGTTIIRISGTQVAYLADEATTGPGGSNFNSDADTTDSVAFIVDLVSRSQTNTGIAARDILWIGSNLYLRVDESLDEVDWNGDMDTTDLVLVHWRAGTATFLAELAPGDGTMLQASGRVFVARVDAGPPGLNNTTLGYVQSSNPLTVEDVGTPDMAAGGLRPTLVRQDEGMVFVTMDETLDGDLNGDMDGTDAFVLGLVDATAAMPLVHNVGLGVASATVPVRADFIASNDWLVGFLVSEAAEAETFPMGLNDRNLFAMSWDPPQCMGTNDTDTTDNVLFYLHFADFIDDMMPVAPENTGLVGVDRVVAVDGYVGTISLEADDGPCDLNGDTDTMDRVFRWTAATTPISPPTSITVLHAIAPAANVPGGTFGVAELSNRFVALVSETEDGRDHNGDAVQSFNLLGWYDPGASTTFTFDHGSGGSFYGGATWMMEEPLRAQLFIGRPENVDGTNENTVFGADSDILDSLPTFLAFVSSGGGVRLSFPTARLAASTGRTGTAVVGDLGVYRVSEAEETLDVNGDGDMTDFVLYRSSQSSGFTTTIGLLNDLPRPAMEVNRFDSVIYGAAIITDESYAGTDLNGDGDATDFVLRHFRL